MNEIKDYRTGKLESYKIDEGVMSLARKIKEDTGKPITLIIEQAIIGVYKNKYKPNKKVL